MLGKVFKSLFTTRSGGYVLVGLLLVGAASAGKVYYGQVNAPEAARASSGVEASLAGVEDALAAYKDSRGDGESVLPPDAPWTPADLECGTEGKATTAEASNPTWSALALPLDKPTRYQFRFRSRESDWDLIARTDTDCDGIYKVFHLKGTSGYNGSSIEPIKIDNPRE
jgi:hypothetical protein